MTNQVIDSHIARQNAAPLCIIALATEGPQARGNALRITSMPQFTLEISYSQVAVFNPSLDQPFNHWTQAHFDQGFVWRPQSVSFRTAARTGFGTVSVDRVEAAKLRDDALLAIRVPFVVSEPQLEIASVFKGETMPFEPGEYTLYFQTGRDGPAPWVSLEFVPGTIAAAEILKGGEFLKPAAELLMSAEPA